MTIAEGGSLLHHRVSAEDVQQIYLAVLNRLPESDAVVASHVEAGSTIFEFLKAILRSEESKHNFLLDAQHAFDIFNRIENDVEVDGPGVDLVVMMDHIRQVWSEYGRTEPHWSVLTSAPYKADVLGQSDEVEFYASGRRDIDEFIAICKRNGVELPFGGKVLDFGCGIARLGEHLSSDFSHYVGVDISAPHLALAEQRLALLGRTNTRLLLLTEFLDETPSYDCLYSILVLQHNPPPVMSALLTQLLSGLAAGGIAYFQLPCAIMGYAFEAAPYIAASNDVGSMEMHVLPQQHVFNLLRESDCELIEVLQDGKIGPIGRSFTFVAQKRS